MKNLILLALFAAASLSAAPTPDFNTNSSNGEVDHLINDDCKDPSNKSHDPSVTPEPANFALLGGGLLIVGLVARKRAIKATK